MTQRLAKSRQTATWCTTAAPINEHIVGTHATYDVSRDTGTFYDVTGSIGIQVKNQAMFLRSSTPFFFTGKVVDKLGRICIACIKGLSLLASFPSRSGSFIRRRR